MQRAAPRHLPLGEGDGLLDDPRQRRPVHLQADRPHELEHLDDDRVRHLGLADDVGQEAPEIGAVRDLPAEQAGHDLDAGEGVLHLVGDRRGHLAEGGQPIAKALALLGLLDERQVLEEERRAVRARSRSSRTSDSV